MTRPAARLAPFLLASLVLHGLLLAAARHDWPVVTEPTGMPTLNVHLAAPQAATARTAGEGTTAPSLRERPSPQPPSSKRPPPARPAESPGDATATDATRAPSAMAAEPPATPAQPAPKDRASAASGEHGNDVRPKEPAQDRATASPAPASKPARAAAAATTERRRPRFTARVAAIERRTHLVNLARERISARLRQRFHYPPLARRHGWEGRVVLRLRVRAGGRITDVAIATSSGHALLDRSARDTVRRIGRIEALAPLPDGPLRLRLPVIFRLQAA